VEGVIICSVTVGGQQAEALRQNGMPIVVINNQSPQQFNCSIAHDDFDGARQVTRHLLSLGHRRIAYLGNEKAERINNERLAGFHVELKDAGIGVDPHLVLNCGGGEIENGLQGMQELLKRPSLPTAVFCFNDLMAIGALRAMSDAGISVPGQVSLAGFDNIEYSDYTHPPLTTFDQPKRAIGAEAACLLLERIHQARNDENPEPIARQMRGRLLLRDSTAPISRKEER
jgi:DNA-binding LacI/PurR family transcriptional regulator